MRIHPPFFEVPPPKKKKYIYGLTLLFFKWLVIANEPKKRIVGGEKRSKVDKKI